MDKQRLQQQRDDLVKSWDLLSKKLSEIERAIILETKPEEKFRLKEQLADMKKERDNAEMELVEIEKLLTTEEQSLSQQYKNSEKEGQPQRIFVICPPANPCKELENLITDLVITNSFELVETSRHTTSYTLFRRRLHNIAGVIVLYVPFNKTTTLIEINNEGDKKAKDITTAWIHNYLGAIAVQEAYPIPTYFIFAKNIDIAGLAAICPDKDCCDTEYPWQASPTEKEKALISIEKHLMDKFLKPLLNARKKEIEA
jgi:hypothetical protein